MFQRICQWFTRAAPLPVMVGEPAPPPTARETFPHKPETLPHVNGFTFRALMLDGRKLNGRIVVAGPSRLILVNSSLPGLAMSVETPSMQGWRHVK